MSRQPCHVRGKEAILSGTLIQGEQPEKRVAVIAEKVLLMVALIATVIMSSCRAPMESSLRNCHEVTEASIRPVSFDAFGPETLEEWISQNYQVETSDITSYVVSQESRSHIVTWNHEGNVYNAYFIDNQWMYLWIRWESQRPTGEQILTCFGSPKYYSARYVRAPHGYAVEVELWYPDEGSMVRFANSVDTGMDDSPPTIRSDWTARHLFLVRPGPIDTVIRDTYDEPDEDINAETLSLKAWPGDWDDLELDIEP